MDRKVEKIWEELGEWNKFDQIHHMRKGIKPIKKNRGGADRHEHAKARDLPVSYISTPDVS